MPKLSIKAGSTSQTVDIFIQDSTAVDGSGKTGLLFNTTGLTAYYNFPRGASIAISLVTLTSPTSAYSSGGFIEIDATHQKGIYRFDVPDALLASGNGRYAKITFQGTGIVPCLLEIELTGWDNQDATNGGITNIGNNNTILNSGTYGNAALLTSLTANGVVATNAYNILNSSTFGNNALFTAITANGVVSTNVYNIVSSGTYGNSSLLTAINNINNLSALANLFGPITLVRPASGTTVYPFTFIVKDVEGIPIDVDTNAVTLTATDSSGTDLSANLSSVTHSGTGEYTFTYTVHSSDANTGLSITASGTIQSVVRKAYLNTSVAAADTVSSLSAIQAKTDKLTFDTSNNVLSKVNAYSTGLSPQSLVFNEVIPSTYPSGSAGYIIGNNLNAPVGSRMASFTLPNGFSTLLIQSGAVAVYQNADKTGYSIIGNSDKTGYVLGATGLDFISLTMPTGMPTTFPGRMNQLFWRLLGRTKKNGSSSPKTVQLLNSSNVVLTTQVFTDNGLGDETLSEVS